MTQNHDGTELLTYKEVMERLRISRTLFYRMIKERKIEGFKEGNKYKVSAESVDRYIATRMKERERV